LRAAGFLSEPPKQEVPRAEPIEKRTPGMVDAELKGNTLRVYIYALKKRKVGVREVQRALLMSNPSLAQYHLNKLKDLGLVSENNGEYEVSNEVKVGVMKDFLRLGRLIVPRFVFWAAFFTVIAGALTYVSYPYFQVVPILGWFVGAMILSAAVFWYEAQRAWRSVPSP
jgi:DNA-binding transcriptional ArsR family regulator